MKMPKKYNKVSYLAPNNNKKEVFETGGYSRKKMLMR
jgi:hypothetical protein